ncbi:hypothetical protein SJR90_11735 [Aeromonas caviae]|uniref:hypothetical protein n=1 Tax=Aeromonas caviae TaxID=648 RepID=UPI0029D47CE4|nr:hypothetical protein [Aeromonas caviae]MDX7783008.1 hypothetical protein [Aeromonas caviae]
MTKPSKVNIKYTLALFLFIGLIISIQIYGHEIKIPIKKMFESDLLGVILWGYVIGIFCIHKYIYGKTTMRSDSFILKHFGSYADLCFGMTTYGLAGTTSLALLKGLYLQQYFDAIYFIGFASFDLVSMFLLSSFLLVYCIFNTSILLTEIMYYGGAAKVEVQP